MRRRVKGRGRFSRFAFRAAWRLAKTRRADAQSRRGRAGASEAFTFGMCERARDETFARASRTFDALLQLPHGFGGGAPKPKRRTAGLALLPLKPGEVRVHLRLQRVGERADVDDDGVGGHGRGGSAGSSARARVRGRFVGSSFDDGAFRVSRVSCLDNQEAKRRRARRTGASSSSPAQCLDVSAGTDVSWTYGLTDTLHELPEASFPRRLERTDRGGPEGQLRVYTSRRRAHVRDVRRARGRRGRASRIPRWLKTRVRGLRAVSLAPGGARAPGVSAGGSRRHRALRSLRDAAPGRGPAFPAVHPSTSLSLAGLSRDTRRRRRVSTARPRRGRPQRAHHRAERRGALRRDASSFARRAAASYATRAVAHEHGAASLASTRVAGCRLLLPLRAPAFGDAGAPRR